MTKWKQFNLAWRFFWFGLIVGLVPTAYRYRVDYPGLVALWSMFAWTLMEVPGWVVRLAALLRRHRRQPAAA